MRSLFGSFLGAAPRVVWLVVPLLCWGCGDDDMVSRGDTGIHPDLGATADAAALDTGPLECAIDSTLGETCAGPADCDDGCFCNGAESCTDGLCAAASAPCATAIECATVTCDEEDDQCLLVANDAMCSDGDACNGAELCDLVIGACRTTAPPYCNDDDSCTVDSCDSATGCVFLARDLDGDGHRDGRCGGDDCDDDPRFGTLIYPGAPEDCFNRRDDNCNGLRDFNELSCLPDNGSCDAARELPGAGTYSGSVRGLTDSATLRCGSAGASDAYYRITLAESRDVTLTAAGGSSISVAMRPADACAEGPDMGCGRGSPASILRRSVPPGDYIIIVEQTGGTPSFDLTIELNPPTVTPPVDICDDGTLDISAGGVFAGLWVEVEDDYRQSCGRDGLRDAAYKLVLDSPKDVEFSVAGIGGGFNSWMLSLATDCEDNSTEVACQSISGSSTFRVRELPAGTYFLRLETNNRSSVAWSLTATIVDPVPRQPGDACSTAIDITPESPATMGGAVANLDTAEFDTGTGCGGASASFRDVVFSFDLEEVQDVTITTESDGSFHYGSLRTTCASVRSEIGCQSSSGTNTLSFRSLDPGTYFITASRSPRPGATVQATVALSEATPIPPNDRCPGAIDISGGYSSRDTLTGFADDVNGCSGSRRPDAFYTFTLDRPQDALIVARGVGGGFSSYTLTLRDECGADRNISCDSGSPAILSQTLEAGTYIVIVEAVRADDFVLQASFFDPA